MKNNERGGSAVEFALALPLLVLLLFGIIEFGFILYDQAVITNASREAARKGIVYHEPGTTTWTAVTDDMIKAANAYGATHLVSLGDASSTSSVTVVGNCFDAGTALTVTVNYPYSFLILPKFADKLTGGLTLKAATVMNCENQ